MVHSYIYVCVCIYMYVIFPNISTLEAKICCQLIYKTPFVSWEGKSEAMARQSNSLHRADDL